jgi:lipopolysaccharide biosynthesis glycosyltransferase
MNALDHKRSLHVVLASDARFAMPLSVTMCSAALNCNARRDITFYVLQHGVGRELRERVERSLVRTPNVRVVWLDVSFADLSEFKTHGHLNPMTYARLLIPWLIPTDVERVIYLDSDLVVLGNLAELWDMEFGSRKLLAVQDRIVQSVDGPLGLSNYREIGIARDTAYFNAGVLLLDLKRWRADKVSEAVLEYLRINRHIIQMVDQEALNAVLFNSWGHLEQRWNWQVGRLHPSRREPVSVGQGGEPSIIHFTTAAKPWLPGCPYQEKKLFFEYLDRTEWTGWRIAASSELAASCRAGVRTVESTIRRLCARALREAIPRFAESRSRRTIE